MKEDGPEQPLSAETAIAIADPQLLEVLDLMDSVATEREAIPTIDQFAWGLFWRCRRLVEAIQAVLAIPYIRRRRRSRQ